VQLPGLVAAPLRQWSGLGERDHRPWSLPRKPWVQGQGWQRLLFIHYRVSADSLARLIPEGLSVETFDRSAWLGVTPFQLTGLRAEGTPPLPWLSSFPELNVRTYLTDGAKPGIWFFSLDAASAVAVRGARRFYHLPYFQANMQIKTNGDETLFFSDRTSDEGPARFRATYRPTGPRFQPNASSLEAFLTERYCLYSHDGRDFHRAEIHHPPWSVQQASAEIQLEGLLPDTIEPVEPPLLHYAHEQHVLIWWAETVRETHPTGEARELS
jgi:uncharacterized protein